MAKLLFHLNGVEDGEANDVRLLLNDANIEFYETDSGRWRLSIAAIWLSNEQDFERARQLINNYQQQRSEEMRDQPTQSFLQRSLEQPVELVFTLLAVVLVLAIMAWPFVSWIK